MAQITRIVYSADTKLEGEIKYLVSLGYTIDSITPISYSNDGRGLSIQVALILATAAN